MENVSFPLLNGVRRDAIEKSRNVEYGEHVFKMIYYLKMQNWAARTKGLFAVKFIAETIEKSLPIEFMFSNKILAAVEHYVYTADINELTEVLTSRYWANDPHGEDALMYYMLILTCIRMGEISGSFLDNFLTACLSDKVARDYGKYKKNFDENEAERLYESYRKKARLPRGVLR